MIAGPPKKNNVCAMTSLVFFRARLFGSQHLQIYSSIKAKLVKAGDAKPRVYCHVLHGYDSLVTENKPL